MSKKDVTFSKIIKSYVYVGNILFNVDKWNTLLLIILSFIFGIIPGLSVILM